MPKRADPGTIPDPHYVTDDEKRAMRAAVANGTTSAAKLAKISGVTRQAICQLMDGNVRTIDYWPAIAKAIGLEHKEARVHDARLQEVLRRWPELSDEDRAVIEAMARQLSRKP